MVDELPPNDDAETVPPPGLRRSTYTPPPAGAGYDPSATDDDALAGALSQQFQQWAPPTGGAPTAPPVGAPPAAAAPPVVAPPAAAPPPAPGLLPPPPQRQSLTDAELLAAADLDAPDLDTTALLDMVERELQLRQAEAQRLADWEQRVREVAGPEAEQVVEQVRSQFTGVIPVVPPQAAAAAASVAASPGTPPAAPPVTASPPPSAPTGLALDLALADAPPPYGASVASVPPPPPAAAPPESPFAPPQLVEPGIPNPPEASAVSAPAAFEALLAASDSATGQTSLVADAEPEPEPTDPEWGEPDSIDPVAEATASGAIALGEVAGPPAGRVEMSALEPTPAEQRAGRSIRLFWLWFAVNASVVSLGLGAVILGLGMSLRQAILATLIGVAISFLPLGLGTLAGKWSGQPTMVVSRATFGTGGNLIPALLAVVTRVVWAAALLWMLGAGVAEVLVGGGLVAGFGRLELTLAVAAVGLVLAATVAGFGFGMIAVVGAVVSVIAGILVVGLIVLTLPYVDLATALSVADGPWILLASGAVLVFSVVGLAWANSSGDLARYQGNDTYGSSAVLFTTFGATIPAFLLISWGAILAASNPAFAAELGENPIDLVARMLPPWYPAPLIAAVALGLLSAAALALYSGGFALLATGLRASRPLGVVVAVVLTGAVTAALALLVPDLSALFRDVVTTLAVPVAAWAGIFGAETMIRSRRVHSPSLLRSGGVYPAVRWTNLILLLVITGVGWGLTTAALTGLGWQGYLFTTLGVPLDSALAESDLGVLASLLLGLLTPILVGIPGLRRLQAAEREASDADAGLHAASA